MGGQQLVAAFQHIPPAARARYPDLCAELGQVHVPDIEQLGLGTAMLNLFGGDLVDMAVNMRARQKIQESMQRLGECERIVARQEQLCQHLLAALHADGAKAATGLGTVNGQLYTEKLNIFNQVRHGWQIAPCTPDDVAVAFEGGKAVAIGIEASTATHRAAATVQQAYRS